MRTSPSALRAASALLSSALLAGLLVVVGVGDQPRGVAPNELEPARGSTYLCYTYSGCRDAGYGNAGYAAVNDRSYWNMYPGHNCTNYVAYRMIQAGMSSARPFGYPGNATNWGEHMAKITDGTARVGAVAWWKAYDNGSGRAGHVAYVEKVTRDYIIISEDSWGGTFHWRKILRTSDRWPTGFIHFVDKVVENTERPQITGTAKLGEELRTTDGKWNVKAWKSYKWFVDGERIPDAKSPTFEVKPEYVGKRIQAKVLAFKKGWQYGKRTTRKTGAVQPGDLTVTMPPTVKGETIRGETLRVHTGAFEPSPDSVEIQWLADGEPIEGATKHRLELGWEHLGASISAQVTARKAAHHDQVVASEPSDWVRKGHVQAVGNAQIKGWRKVHSELVAVPGKARPDYQITPTYQWLRDGEPIEGATKRRYQLAPEDFRRTVGVQITYEHPQRYSDQEIVTLPRPVRARTRMDTEVVTGGGAKGRRVVFKVQVDTRRVHATVNGYVTVEIGNRTKKVRLEKGEARIPFYGMPYGTYDAKVRQHPNWWFVGSRDQVRVKVRQP